MGNNSGDKNIFGGIGWSFAERVSAQAVSLIVSIILARILLPEDYGSLALVSVFVAIGDALAAGGFGIALVQKKDSDELDYNSICWVSIGVSLALYALLYVCAPLIANFYENNELTLITRILGIRLVFSAINSVQQAYIQKCMLFKKNCMVSTIAAIVSGAIGIVMAISGTGVWALVAQNISLVVLTTVLLFVVIEWRPRMWCSFERIKSMWKYGSRVFLATTVDTLKDNIRSLVIGKVFSASDLAFYNQGKRFPHLLVNDIVNSVGKVLLPVFSEQQDEKKKNKELIRFSVRMSGFILSPLIFGLFGVADNFVIVFLTEKWLPCVHYMQILSLMYVTRSLNAILKNALLAIGKSGVNLFHEIVTSIITIGLIFIAAIGYRSVMLIAWSYVIVSVVGTVIFSCSVVREYKYSVKQILQDYLPSFVLSVVMAFIVYWIGKMPAPTVVCLILQVVIGAGIYIGLACVLKFNELQYIRDLVGNKILHRGGCEENEN